MSEQIADDLLKLLEIKKELLVKMLASFRRSAELLDNGDMEALDREMEDCGKLAAMVDELAAPEENMNGHFSDARQKDAIIKANREILYVLGQIEQAQKACNETARRKLQDFGRQIKTVRRTKKGIDGYSNQMKRREAFFIDAKK